MLSTMLLVFAVGVAAWAVSGDESAGTCRFCWPTPSRQRLRVAAPLLALAYAAVAFTVGTVTGSRPAALASATAAGYVAEGLAQQVRPLRPLRAASPGHWLLDSDPFHNGLPWQAWVLPLAVTWRWLVGPRRRTHSRMIGGVRRSWWWRQRGPWTVVR